MDQANNWKFTSSNLALLDGKFRKQRWHVVTELSNKRVVNSRVKGWPIQMVNLVIKGSVANAAWIVESL